MVYTTDMKADVKQVRAAVDTRMPDAEVQRVTDDINNMPGIELPTQLAITVCHSWLAGRHLAETREARILKLLEEDTQCSDS